MAWSRAWRVCLVAVLLPLSCLSAEQSTNTEAIKPVQFVHVTPEYSNAVLKVLLPRFSDFARRMRLDVPMPLAPGHIREFRANPTAGVVGAALWLTNGYHMVFSFGVVDFFRTPRDYLQIQDFSNISEYDGTLRMTKEEVIALAKKTIAVLGYELNDVARDWPMKVWGPGKQGTNMIPFYEVLWEEPEEGWHTYVHIDGEHRRVVGLFLDVRKIRGPDPRVDVQPELESDYRKRIGDARSNMFIRTNAPPRFTGPKDAGPGPELACGLGSSMAGLLRRGAHAGVALVGGASNQRRYLSTPLSSIAAARSSVREPEYGRISTNSPAFEEYGFNLMLSQVNQMAERWKLELPHPLRVNEVVFWLKPKATSMQWILATRNARYCWDFDDGWVRSFIDEPNSRRAYLINTNAPGFASSEVTWPGGQDQEQNHRSRSHPHGKRLPARPWSYRDPTAFARAADRRARPLYG